MSDKSVSGCSDKCRARLTVAASNAVSVLADKTDLVSLNLENNLVDDISALVANPGISGNTYLNLVGNPLMGCVDPIQNENLANLIERCDEGMVTSSCL